MSLTGILSVMDALQMVAIIAAGFAAGTINVIAGAGTLITFPALLALGVNPVVANVSSSIGLIPGSLTGVWGYRRELRGHVRTVLLLGIWSALGAILGGWMLVVLPAAAFGNVVPYLLFLAAALAALQPGISKWLKKREQLVSENSPKGAPVILAIGVSLTGVYGGYFGAAQGVLLLSVLAILWAGSLQEANGIKNALVAVANALSAMVFIMSGLVDWRISGLIGVGAFVGGLIGARISRWLPAPVFRVVLVVVAVVAGVILLVNNLTA